MTQFRFEGRVTLHTRSIQTNGPNKTSCMLNGHWPPLRELRITEQFPAAIEAHGVCHAPSVDSRRCGVRHALLFLPQRLGPRPRYFILHSSGRWRPVEKEVEVPGLAHLRSGTGSGLALPAGSGSGSGSGEAQLLHRPALCTHNASQITTRQRLSCRPDVSGDSRQLPSTESL